MTISMMKTSELPPLGGNEVVPAAPVPNSGKNLFLFSYIIIRPRCPRHRSRLHPIGPTEPHRPQPSAVAIKKAPLAGRPQRSVPPGRCRRQLQCCYAGAFVRQSERGRKQGQGGGGGL
uniref:Uncharacterized protein n=1 Tax=Heterosigma akashiwo TaxID=2829 RepID=A0A7S4D6A9_HETAK